jgi:hypothetical protein
MVPRIVRLYIEARSGAGGGDMGLECAPAMLNELDKRPPPKSPLEMSIEELEWLLESPVINGHAENTGAYLSPSAAPCSRWLEGSN